MTCEGDKYDPSGTLHGGANATIDILSKVQQFISYENRRKDKSKQLHALKEEIRLLSQKEQSF